MSKIKNKAEQLLVLDLTAKQRVEGISDNAFAKKLYISRSLWQGVRTGYFTINLKVIKGAAKAYPYEFDQRILQYLRNGK